MNVLLIEDDYTISQNITEALQATDIHVEVIYDGLLAERVLRKQPFDCVIMDINVPGKNGFDLCKSFRSFNTTTPVIMLTAFGELEDKLQGFGCGADDYLTKPFYMRELIIRIRVLIKRNTGLNKSSASGSTLVAGDITLNEARKKVFREGKEIILTPREYQILLRLMIKKGEIISKADLIKDIWGKAFDANTNTIEVYVNFLRNKLDKPFKKNNIKTKVGYGYYLDVS